MTALSNNTNLENTSLKLLRVDASSRMEESHSREMADKLVSRFTQNFPNTNVTQRDLVSSNIPHIQQKTILGFYTPKEEMSVELQQATALSDKLIAELQSANVLVISTPMYNFSVPSALKAWIDQIVRINETFSMSPEGAFSGLVRVKKAYVITAAGAVFSAEGMSAMDFMTPYLTMLLSFLGIQDVTVIPLEGTASNPEAFEKSKRAALQQIDALFPAKEGAA